MWEMSLSWMTLPTPRTWIPTSEPPDTTKCSMVTWSATTEIEGTVWPCPSMVWFEDLIDSGSVWSVVMQTVGAAQPTDRGGAAEACPAVSGSARFAVGTKGIEDGADACWDAPGRRTGGIAAPDSVTGDRDAEGPAVGCASTATVGGGVCSHSVPPPSAAIATATATRYRDPGRLRSRARERWIPRT